MNCEQIAELLPDYLRGNLPAGQIRAVEQHIEQCAECRDDVAIWNKLAILPAGQPSALLGERFEALLHAYEAGREDGRAAAGASSAKQERAPARGQFDWFRSPLAGLAWGLAMLVVGVLAGTFASRTSPRTDELAAMRTELTGMRQLVVLSMLQQQSASERLQGVSFSRAEAQADPKIIGALLHTLRYDPNVDVRLAALEALSRQSSQAQVRRGVTDALQYQQSPLVQVALIDQLVEWRDPGARDRLRELQQSADLNPAVRQRAEWALSKLN